MMMSDHIRRSIYRGRANNRSIVTSVSVEAAFWRELKRIAAERGVKTIDLVVEIEREGESPNLSRAIRLFVLHHLTVENDELRARLAARYDHSPPTGERTDGRNQIALREAAGAA